MKKYISIFIVLVVVIILFGFLGTKSFAPVMDENMQNMIPSFSKPFVIDVGTRTVFPDGLSVTLREINDSRCKAGMTCIWQGELSPVLVVNGNGFSQEEIRLGTERTKSVSKNGYTFALQDAAETSATIAVIRDDVVR